MGRRTSDERAAPEPREHGAGLDLDPRTVTGCLDSRQVELAELRQIS
jgi:hypothetical protein